MHASIARLCVLVPFVACRPGTARAPDGFDPGPAPRIDVAIGASEPDGVLVYYDVMNRQSLARPDAYLDAARSGVSRPSALEIADNRLYVANRAANTISVYPAFDQLSDGQAPDTVLDLNASLVEAPTDLEVFEDDLYVGQDSDRVLIFQEVASLASGDPPDVVLDSLGSGVDNGTDLAVSHLGLFVANRDAQTVTVYAEPSALTSFSPPSVTLRVPGAIGAGPTALSIEESSLYVTIQGANAVLAFTAIDRASNSTNPAWTIGPASGLFQPTGVAITATSLAVGNVAGSAGLLLFQPGPAPARGVPARSMSGSLVAAVDSVAVAGEVLFCTSRATASLYAFRYPSPSTVASGPEVIVRDPRMRNPGALRAIVASDGELARAAPARDAGGAR